MPKGWEQFEKDVQEALGLDSTISSGSKFFDPGDGVTRGRKFLFPIFADAKYTEKASFTLKLRELLQYQERATEGGRRFLMPIRYAPDDDYVLLTLHDFAELLTLTRDHVCRCPVCGCSSCEEGSL